MILSRGITYFGIASQWGKALGSRNKSTVALAAPPQRLDSQTSCDNLTGR